MKKTYVKSWRASTQPRKQRKHAANLPLHQRHVLLHAKLAKELATKHGKRSLTVRRSDVVKIVRGDHRGKTGKVLRVERKNGRVFVEGIETSKRDGTKAFPGIRASNLVLTELHLDDKKRLKKKVKA